MRLASNLRESMYLSALKGSLSTQLIGENTDEFQSSFDSTEPFPIPDNWKWCHFSDVVSFATNLVDPNSFPDYLQIAPDYIEKGTGVLLPCNTVSQNSIISKNHLFTKGRIIYSKIRPALRKAVIAPFDGLCSADMYPLETKLDAQFLLFYLLSDFFTKKAVEKSSREKMPKINKKDLGQLPIPVPPITEQKRIVDRFNEILPVIEEYERIEEYLINLKDQFPADMRASILQAAIQGKLVDQRDEDGTGEELYNLIQAEKQSLMQSGKLKKEKSLPEISKSEIPFEIPENWKWVRIAEIWNILNGDRGKNYPSKDTLSKVGIPFISALNLDGKTVVDDDNLLCLSQLQYDKLGNGKLNQGDIVVCIRGSLGKHGRYPFVKGAIASSLVIMRLPLPIPTLDDYLMWYLDTPLFFSEIKKYDNGTAQPNLAAKSLEQFLIPLPPLAEQRRIVAKLNELLPLCDNLMD